MAKTNNNYYKIRFLYAFMGIFSIHFNTFSQLTKNDYRGRVIKEAATDIGKIEGVRNTGFTIKYHNVFDQIYKYKSNINDPYCGYGLFAWYWNVGINPNIKQPATAFSWYKHCKNPIRIFGIGMSDFANLPIGSAIVFKVPRGYHVGLLVEVKGFDLITIEANTSSARSITKYSKKMEGVFKLKTSLHSRGITPIAVCDCIMQATFF